MTARMSTASRRLVARSLERVYERIDAPLSLAQLAAELDTSESSLQRAFLELVGLPPATLFRRLRLELAFRTLHSRQSSVLETALASGCVHTARVPAHQPRLSHATGAAPDASARDSRG